MKQKNLLLSLILFVLTTYNFAPASASTTEYSYESQGKVYRYFVVQSGDNYHFEFEKTPESLNEQYTAGVHVLRSLYNDTSIKLENRKNYFRERAKCSLFEGSFYNYTFCIQPNEFSSDKQDNFEGFATQLPNWKWMVTWILLPVALVFGLIFFLTKKRTIIEQHPIHHRQ